MIILGDFFSFLFSVTPVLYNEYTPLVVVVALCVALVVDGIELLVRQRVYRRSTVCLQEFRNSLGGPAQDDDYTFVLPVFRNADEAERSIGSLLSGGIPKQRIIVVDDHSGDDFETARVAASLGVPVVSTSRNTKKVGAVIAALDLIRTRFVIIMDSDSQLLVDRDRIRKAIAEMERLGLDGMAGRVLPCAPVELKREHGRKERLLLEFQTLEFDQAMRLGRGSMYVLEKDRDDFQLKYAEVLGVSGAFGIFRTDMVRVAYKGLKEESILAEDFERTLKILGLNGLVGYSDDIVVLTSSPVTLMGHLRQRVAWSAGLFRTLMSRYGVAAVKRKYAGIQYVTYLIRDILLHPFKLLAMPFLIFYPLEFLSVMGLYVFLSFFILRRVDRDVEVRTFVWVLLPLYRLYMLIFATTYGYLRAFIHSVKIHLTERGYQPGKVDFVRTWNFQEVTAGHV